MQNPRLKPITIFISNRIFLICITALLFLSNKSSTQNVTGVYTDFGGYWSSRVGAINSIRPNDKHNVLGFTFNGQTYSTGVNDPILTSHNVIYSPLIFQGLPVSQTPEPIIGSTYIGVGDNYGGGPGDISPVPVTNNLASYLIDGQQGLDLGTGIYNFPSSSEIYYSISNFNTLNIGDGIPDMIISQMGQVTSGLTDVFRFVDANGATIGNPISIVFNNVNPFGSGSFKFYNPSATGAAPTYNAGLRGNRDLRMIAYDFSAFGITSANAAMVKSFSQKFSGVSDQAFIAYNATTIKLLQPISGTVYIDKDGGVPNGNGYKGMIVTLLNNAGQEIKKDTTDGAGYYAFDNIEPGNYSIKISASNGYLIVGSSEGDSDGITAVTVNDMPVTGVDFGVFNPSLPVQFGSITAKIISDSLIVDWEVLKEENNNHYEIQLSDDGDNFKTVAKIASKANDGNSLVKISYSVSILLNEAFSYLGISIFFFFFVLLLLMGKNKIFLSLCLFVGLSVFAISCKKTAADSITSSKQKIYVRILQVDKDGTISISKIIQPYR